MATKQPVPSPDQPPITAYMPKTNPDDSKDVFSSAIDRLKQKWSSGPGTIDDEQDGRPGEHRDTDTTETAILAVADGGEVRAQPSTTSSSRSGDNPVAEMMSGTPAAQSEVTATMTAPSVQATPAHSPSSLPATTTHDQPPSMQSGPNTGIPTSSMQTYGTQSSGRPPAASSQAVAPPMQSSYVNAERCGPINQCTSCPEYSDSRDSPIPCISCPETIGYKWRLAWEITCDTEH